MFYSTHCLGEQFTQDTSSYVQVIYITVIDSGFKIILQKEIGTLGHKCRHTKYSES